MPSLRTRAKPALAQHPQVLGDGRLGDPELVGDHRGEGPGRLLAVGEQLQQPAPHRIPEDVECVHMGIISAGHLSTSKLILGLQARASPSDPPVDPERRIAARRLARLTVTGSPWCWAFALRLSLGGV